MFFTFFGCDSQIKTGSKVVKLLVGRADSVYHQATTEIVFSSVLNSWPLGLWVSSSLLWIAEAGSGYSARFCKHIAFEYKYLCFPSHEQTFLMSIKCLHGDSVVLTNDWYILFMACIINVVCLAYWHFVTNHSQYPFIVVWNMCLYKVRHW